MLMESLPCHCHQGSYRCGPCKTGYVGDQRRGCKPERACGNGQPNPCHASAECIVHREGTIECQVNKSKILRLLEIRVKWLLYFLQHCEYAVIVADAVHIYLKELKPRSVRQGNRQQSTQFFIFHSHSVELDGQATATSVVLMWTLMVSLMRNWTVLRETVKR